MRISKAIALVLIAALLCVVPGGADARPAQQVAQKVAQKVRHAERLLDATSPATRFSPNGDGSMDGTGFGYRMKLRARVKVAIRNARGDVVRTANLGKRSAGHWHYWSWNGRNRHGAYVRDGAYRVMFTATTSRHGKQLRDTDIARAVARRTFEMSPPSGRAFTPGIYVDRDAIYRDTTYFKDEFHWNGAFYTIESGGSLGSRGASRITGPDGDVVYERGERYDGDNVDNTWDGTDEGGVRVPAGTYHLVNTWTDRYGNHRSVTKPLVVADGSRVERHHSITVTPAEARVGTATEPYEVEAGLRGSRYLTYVCPPKPSDRFPAGALSFALYDPRCTMSGDTFKIVSPDHLDPTFDKVTLAAVGGPTTAGGEGSATLYLDQPSSQPVTTAAGEETTTMLQMQDSWQPDVIDDVTWRVSRATGGYDFKSFTVDILHYAPPA